MRALSEIGFLGGRMRRATGGPLWVPGQVAVRESPRWHLCGSNCYTNTVPSGSVDILPGQETWTTKRLLNYQGTMSQVYRRGTRDILIPLAGIPCRLGGVPIPRTGTSLRGRQHHKGLHPSLPPRQGPPLHSRPYGGCSRSRRFDRRDRKCRL